MVDHQGMCTIELEATVLGFVARVFRCCHSKDTILLDVGKHNDILEVMPVTDCTRAQTILVLLVVILIDNTTDTVVATTTRICVAVLELCRVTAFALGSACHREARVQLAITINRSRLIAAVCIPIEVRLICPVACQSPGKVRIPLDHYSSILSAFSGSGLSISRFSTSDGNA